MIAEQAEKIIFEILVSRIYDHCRRTPLDKLPFLSQAVQNQIWLKREDLQPVHSFKLRGAYHKLSKIPLEDLKKGIIGASAGNHAQGVAFSALKLGVKAKIFMPTNTAAIKIQAVENLGSEIILQGETLLEASQFAKAEAEKTGAVYVHPFNDMDVIAGQGSIGLEILQDAKELPDVLFVPIGGGGLISGVSLVIKTLKPSMKIVGVEPHESNVMTLSIQEKRRIKLDYINPFADGVAVKEVGDITFALCQKYVDDYINVSTDEICFATKIIFNNLRAIPEPSGALALAGLLSYIQKHQLKNKNLIAINTGANIDFERLRFIAERTKIGEGKEILLGIRLKEKPGTLKEFCQKILQDVKISEFNYRYHDSDVALIFIGVEAMEKMDPQVLFSKLKEKGYEYFDFTHNDLAKSHLKYMIGGRPNLVAEERVFQFQFPEHPFAVSLFLEKMSERWNISLFHYRNYGGDYGKIFLGMMATKSEKEKIDQFLKDLNYFYKEETDNPAYSTFLSF